MGLLDSVGDQGGAQPAQQPAAQPVPQDNGRTAFDYFVGQGLAPHQAAGIVGNLQGESGQGLNPAAVNRGDGSDGSDSIGIGQWNGSRAQALKDYATSKGTSWNDLNTQLEFLHSELKGPESKAYGKLTAAQTPEEAGQAMLGYERPKDWNKPGAHPERAQYAARAYSAYGTQPTTTAPQATPAPANMAQNAPQRPGLPLNILPPQQAPVFAPQQSQQQAQAAPSMFAGMPAEQVPQMAPIFVPPRKPINLSALRAAFGQRTA